MSTLDLLLNKLLVLLNHDKATLKRLVNGAIARYPSQRATWYLERVIRDLERDRGRF